MASNWLHLGLILTGELIFAVLVALITRLFSKHLEAQTLGLVVLGVAGVVTIAGFQIGWMAVGFLAICFSVSALPMAVEYYSRMIAAARRAKSENEKMLDVHPGADR